MALRHRVLDFLGVRLCALCVLCGPNDFRTTRRVHSLCAVPDTGTDGSQSRKKRLAQSFLKQASIKPDEPETPPTPATMDTRDNTASAQRPQRTDRKSRG